MRCSLLACGLALFFLNPGVSRGDLWGLSVDPYGTAAPGTETNYNKVFRFDNAGNKLPNDIPTNSAGLIYPSGIAVGLDNHIYISSQATGSILHFDSNGIALPTPQTDGPMGLFAALGTAAPAQLAIGPDGNLYVSEFFGSTVRVYDTHPGVTYGLRLPDAVTGLSSAGGLAFAANGDLFVGDGFAQAAGQSAQIVRVHDGVKSTFGATNLGGVYAPSALLRMADDSLLVVDLVANYIAHYDANGMPLAPFAVIPPAVAPPGSNFPSDIKFDPDGNIIVSVLGMTNPPDNRGALLRYDLNGNLLETIKDHLEPIGGIDWTASPATLASNYNGDAAVNAGDYANWRSHFGKFVARANGADGNGNGVIDAADYVRWRDAASAVGSGSIAGGAVPEPTTACLLAIGLLPSGLRRRRG